MKECNKVYQDTFGEKGTCMSACIASLLKLNLTDVPRFIDLIDYSLSAEDKGKQFYNLIVNFLKSKGYGLHREFPEDKEDYLPFNNDDNFFYIVCGKSKRGNNHAVIYNNGFPFFDPHGDDGFVINPHSIEIIYRIEE